MNSLQPQAGRRMFVFLLSPVCGRHGRFLCPVRRAPSRATRVAPHRVLFAGDASLLRLLVHAPGPLGRDLYALIALAVMGVHSEFASAAATDRSTRSKGLAISFNPSCLVCPSPRCDYALISERMGINGEDSHGFHRPHVVVGALGQPP